MLVFMLGHGVWYCQQHHFEKRLLVISASGGMCKKLYTWFVFSLFCGSSDKNLSPRNTLRNIDQLKLPGMVVLVEHPR